MPHHRRRRQKRRLRRHDSASDDSDASSDSSVMGAAAAGPAVATGRVSDRHFHIRHLTANLVPQFFAWLMELRDVQRDCDQGAPLVTIDSGGGVVRSALAVSSLIHMSPVPLRVLVLSRCWSSATIIFLSFPMRFRFALPHATFMVHFGTEEIRYTSKEEQRLRLHHNEGIDNAYNQILLSACTKSHARRSLAERLSRHEPMFFTVEEVVRMGWLPDTYNPETTRDLLHEVLVGNSQTDTQDGEKAEDATAATVEMS